MLFLSFNFHRQLANITTEGGDLLESMVQNVEFHGLQLVPEDNAQ